MNILYDQSQDRLPELDSIVLYPVDDQQPEVKAEQAPAPVKKEAPIVAETKVLDGAAPPATSGKKKNSAKKQKTEPGNDDTVVQDYISAFFTLSN